VANEFWVLDADLGLANLDVVLNLYPKITLHDVFTGKAKLEEAIIRAPGGFSVLLAGSGMVEIFAPDTGSAGRLSAHHERTGATLRRSDTGHGCRHFRRGFVRCFIGF